MISFASALQLEKVGYDWDNVGQFTQDITTSKYGKYEIRNSILGLSWFQYGKVADLELTNNSESCGEGCFAVIPITLYKDGILVDEITFETLQPDGSWISGPIRSYKFSYPGEITNYKKVCNEIGQSGNGTIIQECSQVEDGTRMGKINYREGEVVKAGTYLLRLDGNKKPSRTVDWKIKTNGIWTNEWAVWGNISLGDDAEVILNSPEDNHVVTLSTQEFNCSANITGGATIINMSLYTNQSGVWEAKNTTNISEESTANLISYWTLDDDLATTNVIDLQGLNDGILFGGDNTQDISALGKINLSLDLDGVSDIINITDDASLSHTSMSIQVWIKTTDNEGRIIMKMRTGGGNEYGLSILTGGNISADFRQDGAGSPVSPLQYNDGNWHHVVMTGVENTIGGVLLYVDGALVATGDSSTFTTNSPLIIGSRDNGADFYDGLVDEVGIWNKTLTPEEILQLYNSDSGIRPGALTFSTQTWTRTIDETIIWNCEACDSDGDCGLGVANRTLFADTTGPIIDVESPNGTLDYNFIGGNETLNVTFTDENLPYCWYNYNGTNVTIEGCLNGVKNSTQFILEENNFNMTLYANDTLGNLNSTFIEWDYILLEKSITYDPNITEGEINQISIKVIINEISSITNAILIYGGINYTTSTIFDGENYTLISSNAAPLVGSDTNFSFNFIISVDSIEYETQSNNQTVLNLDFDICGGASNDTLLNMSLFDEETLTTLTGDIEFNAEIISKSSGETIATSNTTFSGVHSGAVCFSPVSSYPLYYINAEIRYFKDGYATEFYHIQRADMANYPVNLSLFDLNQNDSTEFSITYKNNNFIFTEGAVIQLQRKYIGEDIYRVVEAPVTGDGGKAILHIDLNTNKYRISVVKGGELLDFFEDIVFNCDNELAGDCTHSLDGTVDPNNDIPIEELTDFSYSVSIDEENKTVTVLFAVPSGTPSTISVLLRQLDTFGNLTSCNTTIITSAGSITCDYVGTIEKSILELTISKDEVQLVILSYMNDPELDMDGINFFIVFLFMISLVGMAISSPEWMIIISVMVLMISGTMLLLKGVSLVVGLGAIAWVLIAAAIIIFKMAKQEDR